MHLSRSWFQWTTGKLTALGTFAKNCFCACLQLRTQIHMPRHASRAALSTKMNNDRAAIALLGFNVQ